jgi:hypothetical protein
LIVIFCFFSSCQNPAKRESEKVIDSLNKNIMILTSMIDSLKELKNDAIDTKKKQPENEHKLKKIPSQPQKINTHKAAIPEDEDTIKYYYKNNHKISCKITPWNNGKRKLLFYNPNGIISYIIEDMKFSFTSISEINKFHENGAVALVTVNLNPDASMYWYKSVISFSQNNEPEWKEDHQYPEEHVLMPGSNRSYWKSGAWQKLESPLGP